MEIEKVVQFKVNGQMFHRLIDAEGEVENLIGLQIDKMCRESHHIGPRDKIIIFDYLMANKKEIADLLLCDFDDED